MSAVTPKPSPAVSPSLTDWSVFEKLRLNPKVIRCDSYKPLHGYDASCHTTVRPKFESITSHISADHGGAFYLELTEIAEGGKVWSGWSDLAACGAELTDLRDANNTGRSVGVTVHDIRPLMSRHPGVNQRPVEGGKFFLTISLPKRTVVPADEE